MLAVSAAAQSLPSSWDLYPATAIGDRSLAFDIEAEGVSLPILWGFDTAWNDEANMLRGLRYTGSDIIGVARVSFQPWAEITEKGVLPPMLQENLNKRMKTVGMIGHKVDIALNLDGGEPTIKEIYGGLDADKNYIGNPDEVADAYARLIDATAAAVQAKGYRVVSAAPFNEPDYFWNGTPINIFNEINRRLKNFDEYPRFADIRISGGNTLNCDEALPWYSELKECLYCKYIAHRTADILRRHSPDMDNPTGSQRHRRRLQLLLHSQLENPGSDDPLDQVELTP